MIIIEAFVLIGVVSAAISGALIAMRKRLDLFGIVCIAVATALGGGMIRDICIGQIPPIAFMKPVYFLVALSTAIVTVYFAKQIKEMLVTIMITDAIGLGVFTALGANAALLKFPNEMFLVISMGLITGIGGGIMRDVFVKDIPYVFRREVYAICAILGAVSFYYATYYVPLSMSLYISLFITFTTRILAVKYDVHFPVFKYD